MYQGYGTALYTEMHMCSFPPSIGWVCSIVHERYYLKLIWSLLGCKAVNCLP